MEIDGENPEVVPGSRTKSETVFWVYHAGHRRPHMAIVLERQQLPPCSVCGLKVRYVRAGAPLGRWGLDYINQDPDFLEAEN